MLEILTPTHAFTLRKGAAGAFPASAAAIARELLPGLIAILVLTALSLPVLLILWRLHQSVS